MCMHPPQHAEETMYIVAEEALPLWDDESGPFILGGMVLVQVCKSVLLVCLAIKVLPTKQKDFTLHKATCNGHNR